MSDSLIVALWIFGSVVFVGAVALVVAGLCGAFDEQKAPEQPQAKALFRPLPTPTITPLVNPADTPQPVAVGAGFIKGERREGRLCFVTGVARIVCTCPECSKRSRNGKAKR